MAFRILTIIPARAGSKGLRGKNIRKIAGKPLLTHAIELAQKSQRKGENWSIVVSTDSRKYAQIARKAGATIPELRPKNLAQDTTRLTEVVFHTLDLMESHQSQFDCVMLITPSTPLTIPADLRRGIRQFKKEKLVSLASVTEIQRPPSWVFSIKNGRLQQEDLGRVEQRQSQAPTYQLNGALYLANPTWLRTNGQFVRRGETQPLLMPKSRAIDIENADDLSHAKYLFAGRSTPANSVQFDLSSGYD